VLAGWKSADGRRHDYWFTFINGMAVAFGLVDDAAPTGSWTTAGKMPGRLRTASISACRQPRAHPA